MSNKVVIDSYKQLQDIVVHEQHAQKMTTYKLAKQADQAWPTIRRLMSDQTEMRLSNLMPILKVLGLRMVIEKEDV